MCHLEDYKVDWDECCGQMRWAAPPDAPGEGPMCEHCPRRKQEVEPKAQYTPVTLKTYEVPVYPHMCRDGHPQIGHSDSRYEQCPLCRAIAALEMIAEDEDTNVEAAVFAKNTLRTLKSE